MKGIELLPRGDFISRFFENVAKVGSQGDDLVKPLSVVLHPENHMGGCSNQFDGHF